MFSTQSRIFPGWWIVATGVIGLMFGFSSFLAIAFGLFIKPLSGAFGWERAQISLAMTICAYSIIPLAPIAGMLIDRFGIRRVIMPSLLLLGLLIASFSMFNGSLTQFYFGYFLVALFGCGSLPITYTKAIINWFNQRRGLALGIVMAGVGLSGMILPVIIEYIISHFGWRSAYIFFAGTILFITLPSVYFLLYERPEEFGLKADGLPADAPGSQARIDADVAGFSFKQALQQRPFWLLIAAFALLGAATIGVIAHMMALLTDRGLPPQEAAVIVSTSGIAVLVGRVFCGYLLDRLPATLLAFLCICSMSGGIALLALGVGGFGVYAAVMMIGLGAGAEFDFMSYFVSRYFGGKNYGKIYGFIYGIYCLGSGSGPVFMGRIYDISGHYTQALWYLSLLTFTAATLFLFMGPYREDKWRNPLPVAA